MRILAVRANPRKDGHTEYVTDLLLAGAVRAGADVDVIDLAHATVKGCLGCYHCWVVTPGACVHNDDMAGFLERLLRADVLFCATPVYHYAMSHLLKAFLERTFPLVDEGLEETSRGCLRNRTRYPDRWKKTLAYVAVGALRAPSNFDGLRLTFDLIAEGMNMTSGGGIVRPESYFLDFQLAKPIAVRMVERAMTQAGRELALHGAIAKETQEMAEQSISPDGDLFQKYNNVHWEHAIAMEKEGVNSSPAALRQQVGADVRILMHEMTRNIDPVRAARLEAVLQFDFPDKGWHYRVEIDHGACRLEATESDVCDLRVTVESSLWPKILTREVGIREHILNGKLRLEGDKHLFSQLERLFPPARD